MTSMPPVDTEYRLLLPLGAMELRQTITKASI